MLLSDGGAELPRKFAIAIQHPIYGMQYRLKTAEHDGPFWYPFIVEETMFFDKRTEADRAALAVKSMAELMGSAYMTAQAVEVTPLSYLPNA
jgi:hypothetical protein